MVQINKTAGRVLGVALSAFTLAGCGGTSFNCPFGTEGRSVSTSASGLFSTSFIFKQDTGDIVGGKKTSYGYIESTAQWGKISKIKGDWVCEGEMPKGSKPTVAERSVWWGL